MFWNSIMYIFYNCHKCVYFATYFFNFTYTPPTIEIDVCLNLYYSVILITFLYLCNKCKMACL